MAPRTCTQRSVRTEFYSRPRRARPDTVQNTRRLQVTSKAAHEARAEVEHDALNVLALLQQGGGFRVEGFGLWVQG